MPYSNKQMLRDANGDLIPQYWDVVEQEFKPLTGRDGANDVRLTGSNVEVVDVFDAVAFTNESRIVKNIDVSKFRRFQLVAYASLNVSVEISVRAIRDWAHPMRVYEDGEWKRFDTITIEETNRQLYLLNTKWAELNKMPYTSLDIGVRPTDTPTSGSFTLQVWGELR